MNNTPEVIDSWLDLTGLIEKLAKEPTNWIFRGEPSDTYELRTACGRQGSSREHARALRYDLEHERAALARLSLRGPAVRGLYTELRHGVGGRSREPHRVAFQVGTIARRSVSLVPSTELWYLSGRAVHQNLEGENAARKLRGQ